MGASLYPRGLRVKLAFWASRIQFKPFHHGEMRAVTWKFGISADLCRGQLNTGENPVIPSRHSPECPLHTQGESLPGSR